MSVAVDTNILVRFVVDDDPAQGRFARELLTGENMVAMPITALCEMVWVLSKGYRLPAADIAEAIRAMTSAKNVRVDQAVVNAGLALLDRGADFADGVIAHEGRSLGAWTFVSFDRTAVKQLTALGFDASGSA